MKNKTLIIYASVDGQTQKICIYLLNILSKQGQETHIFPIQGLNVKLDSYEKLLLPQVSGMVSTMIKSSI
jgi:menaquinone-dependent protoporphyrinogen oxidase